jgi:4-amino-4-deoxychorismate lyase
MFFETIKILDGKWCNLVQHQLRVEHTTNAYYKTHTNIKLDEIKIPDDFTTGLVKCKVYYNHGIYDIQYSYYEQRKITEVKFIPDDGISYIHKFVHRSEFDFYKENLADYQEAIIIKHGLITESTYANVCLNDGHGWVTPKYPLLKGTKRAQLLQSGIIQEQVIHLEDIIRYKQICLINAMLELGDSVVDL